MASGGGDDEWVYVDEGQQGCVGGGLIESSADSPGGKDCDNDTSGSPAAEVDGELPGGAGATATSEAVDADVTASEEDGASDEDEEAVGSDYDASSYGATEIDDYLEYEEDIDGVASLKIKNVEATPPIFLDDDDFALAGADAAEESPANPRYAGVRPPLPYGYLYPRYRYDYVDGAYYGGQYQYPATYYLPPPVPHTSTYPYGYAPYAPPPPPKD